MTEPTPPIQLSSRAEITRRDALKLFAAGVAALEAGCMQRPGEEIRPAVVQAEASPGVPRWFATAMTIDGYATGLLVEAHAGRPIKIEGNPAHPASLGATTAQHQASILDLYDPYRLRGPRAAGLPATWDRLARAFEALPAGERWLVLPPESSPTIAALLERVRARHPGIHILHHAMIDRRASYRGAQLAFGEPLELQLALDRCDVLVALDADVLGGMPMSVRWSRDFAGRRRAVEPGEDPARLFVAEPMLTPTGSLADHRLAIRAGDIPALVVALAGALAAQGVAMPALPKELTAFAMTRSTALGEARWLERAASSLARRRGGAAIVVGERQPPAVHALAYQLSVALGAVGRTTTFTAPAVLDPLGPAPADGLDQLIAAARGNQVGAVIAIDVNPVYGLRRDLDLAGALRRVPLTVHATQRPDETSAVCGWVVPTSHYLEAWGDARAADGTVSVIQPLIQPLHASRSPLEILALLAGEPATARELVRAHWRDAFPTEPAWHAVLAEGVMASSTSPARAVTPVGGSPWIAELGALLRAPRPADELELDLASSPALLDGRFAANPWLQELPHPMTKQTWGNAALLGVATARRLAVNDGDVLRLLAAGGAVEVPAIVVRGHAEACITLELGYGRITPEVPIGDAVGTDASVLARGGMVVPGVDARPTGKRSALARTQEHLDQHGRDIAVHFDLATYRAEPEITASLRGPLPTLLDPPRHDDVIQWAMTIDTTICTGCSSCVIACQAENNVPFVGPEGVRKNREMHWLRIDTYISDQPHGIEVTHQPMLCQHCEHAPCEYVCPTFATVHSPDGLNEMVYNRCIGTRFCSNNCPYKVRRFNFFGYDEPATLRSLQHNPDVTVRARGVMEKCTYCVQRIRGAEIQSRMERRAIRPGEVVTACQQACPTGAIQFGALGHADTAMVRWRNTPRAYAVLHELGTRPRTMYLAKVRAPEDEGT